MKQSEKTERLSLSRQYPFSYLMSMSGSNQKRLKDDADDLDDADVILTVVVKQSEKTESRSR